MIGYDTETHLILQGRVAPRLVCLTTSRGDLLAGADAVEHMGALLKGHAGHAGHAVAHNAPFDLAVLCEAHRLATGTDDAIGWVFAGLEAGRLRCTRLREQLLNIAEGESDFRMTPTGIVKTSLSLAGLVERYFGVQLTGKGADAWRMRYHELDGVDPRGWPTEAREYAIEDAVWALRVFEAQCERAGIGPEEYIPGEQRDTANDFALHLMGAWGQRTDPAAVEATVAEWARLSDASRQVGRDAGFVRVTGRDKGKADSVNKKALQARVSLAYNGNPPMTKPSKTFPGGQVKADEETLRDSGDELLAEYAMGLHYTNWMSKYAQPLRDGVTHPVTPRYNVLVDTGRTSCSKPPQQQPPRKGGYRECWVPRPGYLYAGADYDAIELCALAQVCLWLGLGSALGETINAGQDPHLVTAVAVLNAEGTPAPGGGLWDYPTALQLRGESVVGEARQISKVVNFGFPGGLTGKSFAGYAKGMGVAVDDDAGNALRSLWLATYPEMNAYFAWVDAQLDFNRTMTCTQFVSGRRRGGCRRTVAYNTYFQALVADGAKHALWLLAREAYAGEGPFAGCRPVLFLHDEIIAEVPIERAAECADYMAGVMRDAMALHIPDIHIGCEPVLMERWYKGAETVRDDRGILQVWRPT